MTNDARFGEALPAVTLVGEAVRLRAFGPGDLSLVEDASSDGFIATLTTVPAVFTVSEGEAFIERQIQRRLAGEGWSLAIVDVATDVAVGQIGVQIAHLHKGRAELGYWVGPSHRGSGAASQAVSLISEWAFENLDVSRLSCFIEPWNIGSIRTAERAGFHREGLLRGWERVGGVAKDMLSFAQLAPTE